MTTSAETARVVEQVSHPAVRMQFDTGALTINGEDPAAVLQNHAGLIGHIHVSEPNLVPLGDGGTDHDRAVEGLMRFLPEHLACIEMLATTNEPHLASIQRALKVAIRHYRGMSSQAQPA
jgi:sugar phosphate isomerase/epimerase